MRGWMGAVAGFAALALFGGIVRSKAASSRVGGLLAKAGTAVNWFVSPEVPFFATGTPKTQSAQSSANTQSPSTSTTRSTGPPAALAYGGQP